MRLVKRPTTRLIGLFLSATTAVFVCCEMNTDEIDGETIQSREQGLVEFTYFSGNSREGGVLLTWGTRSESNTAGFNLFRKKTDEVDYGVINESLIPSKSPDGAEYEYFDHPLDPGSYNYQMEEVDNEGTATPHGGSFTVTVFGGDSDSGSVCSPLVIPTRKNRSLPLLVFARLFDL